MQPQGNPPHCRVFFRLDIASKKETLLADTDLTRLLSNGDDWETNLADPEVHEAADILTGSLAQRGPKVTSGSVRILVSLEVIGDTLKEHLLAEMGTQHADDGATFQVADVIKDLIDFKTVVDRYFDGVGGA